MKCTSAAAPVFTTHDSGAGLLVDKITFSSNIHTGANISITVKGAAKGDARLEIGRVDSASTNLGTFLAPKVGVLEFDAGDGTDNIPAVKSLVLGGIGNLLNAFNGGGNFDSLIFGKLPSFTLLGNIGKGKVTLDGNQGTVGVVKVAGSLRGDMDTTGSGVLSVKGASIKSVTIGGSIVGGIASGSGALDLTGPAGSVKIAGSVIGGRSSDSGDVDTDEVKSFTIGGSIVGGIGGNSATVNIGAVSTVTIGGSIIGGAGINSAQLNATGKTNIIVKGSLIGGQIPDGGALGGGTTATIFTSGGLAKITIKGDIIAGRTITGTTNQFNGCILSYDGIASLTVGGSIIGNNNTHVFITGTTSSAPAVNNVQNVIGTVKVGRDVQYGEFLAGYTTSANFGPPRTVQNPDAAIGSITIGGDWNHTIAYAGVTDTDNNGPTTNDVRPANSSATLISAIGSIVVKGKMLDDFSASNYSGIEAERIGKVVAGGVTLFKTSDTSRFLDTSNFVLVREI